MAWTTSRRPLRIGSHRRRWAASWSSTRRISGSESWAATSGGSSRQGRSNPATQGPDTSEDCRTGIRRRMRGPARSASSQSRAVSGSTGPDRATQPATRKPSRITSPARSTTPAAQIPKNTDQPWMGTDQALRGGSSEAVTLKRLTALENSQGHTRRAITTTPRARRQSGDRWRRKTERTLRTMHPSTAAWAEALTRPHPRLRRISGLISERVETSETASRILA